MKYTFVIEKTNTGYSAYAKHDDINIGTTGSTLTELENNVVEALALWVKVMYPSNLHKVSINDIDFVMDDVRSLEVLCHKRSVEAGWYKDPKTGEDYIIDKGVVCEKLSLIHSEVSEALEGYRKNLMDDKLPHRKMVEVELADAIIRIFDLAGALKLNVTDAIHQKMEYNLIREDHKLENRALEGGKQF